MRLNGWQIFGVVLTVIWVLVSGIGVYFIHYWRAVPEEQAYQSDYSICASNNRNTFANPKAVAAFCDRSVDASDMNEAKSEEISNILAVPLIPTFIWLLFFVVVKLFKKTKAKPD